MRNVRLVTGPGTTLLLASVLTGGCGEEATDSGSNTPSGGNAGAAGAITIGGHIGHAGRGGSAGDVRAGECQEPPKTTAWSDCENAPAVTPTD